MRIDAEVVIDGMLGRSYVNDRRVAIPPVPYRSIVLPDSILLLISLSESDLSFADSGIPQLPDAR